VISGGTDRLRCVNRAPEAMVISAVDNPENEHAGPET
jgi:hypothetical protein